jgi:hypothetical protein
MFEAERPSLVRYTGPFDGFHAKAASVSKTCLVQFDKNKYSVMCQAVGRPIEAQAYADRIVMRQDGGAIASHDRCFGREQTVYDLWHYVPVLARKPGAMRNGAPFKDWILPGALGRVRRRWGLNGRGYAGRLPRVSGEHARQPGQRAGEDRLVRGRARQVEPQLALQHFDPGGELDQAQSKGIELGHPPD